MFYIANCKLQIANFVQKKQLANDSGNKVMLFLVATVNLLSLLWLSLLWPWTPVPNHIITMQQTAASAGYIFVEFFCLVRVVLEYIEMEP